MSTNPTSLVPTTVSREELAKLVSEWRPYCLMTAIYFKLIRYGVSPIAVVCIIGWAIGEVPWYVPLMTILTVVGIELLRKVVPPEDPFLWGAERKVVGSFNPMRFIGVR